MTPLVSFSLHFLPLIIQFIPHQPPLARILFLFNFVVFHLPLLPSQRSKYLLFLTIQAFGSNLTLIILSKKLSCSCLDIFLLPFLFEKFVVDLKVKVGFGGNLSLHALSLTSPKMAASLKTGFSVYSSCEANFKSKAKGSSGFGTLQLPELSTKEFLGKSLDLSNQIGLNHWNVRDSKPILVNVCFNLLVFNFKDYIPSCVFLFLKDIFNLV